MEILKITNLLGQEVCHQYCNKEIDLSRCEIKEGKPLKIVYKSGSGFNHEKVEYVWYIEYGLMTGMAIITTKKIWTLGNKT